MTMSAVPAPASKGVHATAPVTFRAIIDARKAEGGRLRLDDAIAVIVPVCLDLKERHIKGESFYVRIPGTGGESQILLCG